MKKTRARRARTASVGVAAGELLSGAAERIGSSPAIDQWQDGRAEDDAEVMLGDLLGLAADESVHPKTEVTADVRKRFEKRVKRRVAGEPVALITGHFDFRGLRLPTRAGVFIPRYSTELVVNEAAKILRRTRHDRVVVDLCTGMGPIAMSLAHEVRGVEVYGLDIAADAIKLGKKTARQLGMENISFRRSDMLKALPKRLRGGVAVITMHPPYVARDELLDLPSEIRDHEPVHTLSDMSDDGLGLVRKLVDQAPKWLAPRGSVLIEIGPELSKKVAGILRRGGLSDVKITRDAVGATRVVVGRLA